MARKRDPQVENLVRRVMRDFEEDSKAWDSYRDQFARRYRAYRGLMEGNAEAVSEVTGYKLQHPAVVLMAIETMTASMLDPSPKVRVRARPVIADPEEVKRRQDGAKAVEMLTSYQIECDGWAQKQRPFDLQGLICGITGSKQSWSYREGDVRYQEAYSDQAYDNYGAPVGPPEPRLRDATKTNHVLRDEPTSEVIDMFDFVPHNGARSLETCDRVHHVVWYTKDQLLEMEKNHRYGVDAGGEPISRLDDEKGPQPKQTYRGDIFDQNRPRDQIRCVESWIDRGKRVVTIAGSDTLIEDRPNPYWFDYLDHRFPFVVASAMPDNFRIPGISEVEHMLELQGMLWTLMNTRLDATLLLAQPMFFVPDDVEDPDAIAEIGPGEVKLVPRPVAENFQQWSPDPNVPQMTLAAESLVRGDLQDVIGGLPYQATGQSNVASQQTATGVSIVTTLAQKRLAAKKQQYSWAKTDVIAQFCALDQQYLKEEVAVREIGQGGYEAWHAISPDMIQGVYTFDAELVDDSLIRQERRSEQQAKLQTLAQIAPVAAAIGQPINLRPAIEDYLAAYDVTDPERYFAQAPQPQVAQMGQNGQQGQNGAAGAGGMGITNPAAAAGPQSPSNPESMSPQAAMSRMLAQQGSNNLG